MKSSCCVGELQNLFKISDFSAFLAVFFQRVRQHTGGTDGVAWEAWMRIRAGGRNREGSGGDGAGSQR